MTEVLDSAISTRRSCLGFVANHYIKVQCTVARAIPGGEGSWQGELSDGYGRQKET